ncbi:SpoV family signaling peptide [Streptococcus pyogenes]|uniref:SpoV family signaling peptide n=1 Tax=Streptococcus pyogenes TaxID=1314 RepID=UPI00109D1C31|nr:SpoV family signaling peptide [Streptococcus pyogenes]VHB01512.1 Uncharacterised protein [Streptococcus pyogenes]VHB49682.1 Uncharacterised protein [Streptococcus pyogenes]VHB51210.1 Uncharacterised protein [Streptococcus pyogenes]VHB63826.1 Uncharacterised protein [Streptococcus pyogenes]VHF67435.1 Uncharacterised protein [Streptococcus pyogenes]
MKNKLFLIALATVTVLGSSLATPRHQTVHAAEQAVTQKTATETCTLDGKICYGYENTNEDHTDSMVQSKSQAQGFFSRLWTTITNWFSSLMLR